ncbi:MAG: hypothetical protein ACYC6Y_16195 [Thermoguttaceae bacterium]
MDQETIENHIKNLGKRDFDAVVRLIMVEFFRMKAIDVDGKGDGGSDLRVFSDENSNCTISCQKTVQDVQWARKAFEDAKTSKEQLDALRYFFLTSRAHESTSLRDVENKVSSELGMPAVCLGATEIAGIIIEQHLLRQFAEAIGLPLNVTVGNRPDRAQVLLHAYVALGSDRSDLRNEVYDDSLLLALHEADSAIHRSEISAKAADLLGADAAVQERLERRIDSLLARRQIEPAGGGFLRLSDSTKLQLQAADGVYVKELENLASAQSQILKDECDIEWDKAQCESAATLLSRWFIQRQLVAAEHMSAPLTRVGLSRSLGDPEPELRQLLLDAGVRPSRLVQKVIDEFVTLASDMPLIKKLTRAVTYVATEGQDLLKASRVLGASDWAEVTTTLDASVAIPYICASLFEPTQGRFSYGANECLSLLKKAGARLVIPGDYINEVASHLLRALDYPETSEFDNPLEHSKNGFVAHYFQLKAAGKAVPTSLRGFIEEFSRAALRPKSSPHETIRAIMAEIQPLLADFGVQFEDISRVPQHFRKDVEQAYIFKLSEMKRVKPQLLIEHDVKVLSHLRQSLSERGEVRMCLSWDAVMIAVGLELQNCGWIVSPHEAADIVQARLKISDTKLTALAHSLARVRERPSEMGARIIDRVVQLAGEQMQNWQFRKRLGSFYKDALQRIDLTGDSYRDIDKEIEGFLATEGFGAAASDLDAGEE